jgi:hypothetical protein
MGYREPTAKRLARWRVLTAACACALTWGICCTGAAAAAGSSHSPRPAAAGAHAAGAKAAGTQAAGTHEGSSGCTEVTGYQVVSASETLPCVTVDPGGTLAVYNNGGCGTAFPAITLTLAGGGTVDAGGTIALYSSNSCDEGGDSTLDVASGKLVSNGTIAASWAGPGGNGNANGGSRYIEGNVTSNGTTEVSDLTYFQGGTFTNNGSFGVSDGSSFTFEARLQSGESFVNGATGSITVGTGAGGTYPGVFQQYGGTFTEAGTTSGPDPALDAGTLDYTGSGVSTITAQGAVRLKGAIAAGQTLTLEAGTCSTPAAVVTTSGRVTNAGTLSFAYLGGGCGSSPSLTMPTGSSLANSGTINATSATNQSLTGTLTNTGTIYVANMLTMSGPGTFTNSGSLSIADGSVATVAGASAGQGLVIKNGTGGSIAGNGASGQLVITGPDNTYQQGAGTTSGNPVAVQGGNTLDYTATGSSVVLVEGAVALAGGTIGAKQQILISSGACSSASANLTVSSNVTNHGTVTFYELPGGCEGGGTMTVSDGTFHNAGTLAADWSGTISGPVSNTGTIEAPTGTLTIGALDNLASGTLTGGAYTVSGNGQMQLPGPVTTLAASVEQDGSGSFDGALNGLSAIGSGGALTVGTGANMTVPGGFTNSGTITLGSADTLQVDGNYAQGSAGRLAVDVAGTTAGSTYGQLAVAGTATLAGTLAITKEYTPAKGDTQQPVTYSASSGQFSSVTGTGTGTGQYFVLRYTPQSAELVVAATKLTLTPVTGAPGTKVRVKGSGFSPGETVALSFKDASGTVTTLPSATAGSGGRFTVSDPVPAGASTGAASFIAAGQVSYVSVHHAFTVS